MYFSLDMPNSTIYSSKATVSASVHVFDLKADFRTCRASKVSAPSRFRNSVLMWRALENARSDDVDDPGIAR